MASTQFVAFNVKSFVYAFQSAGVWGTPVASSLVAEINLEADFDQTNIYGDGKKQFVFADDQGLRGTLSVVGVDTAYEIACGRAVQGVNGVIDVDQSALVPHCIGFEIEFKGNEGETTTRKVWLYNVVTNRPSEDVTQKTDSVTVNNNDIAFTVLGTELLNTAGTDPYVDANGNTKQAYRQVAKPADTGYATFLDTVVLPKKST